MTPVIEDVPATGASKIVGVYEGKAKVVARTDHGVAIMTFKDDVTAGNGAKRATIDDKGRLANEISANVMQVFELAGIPTHFVELLDERRQVVESVDIVPIEVVIRNVVAGSLVRRTGLAAGTVVKQPIVEFYLKDDDLDDPLINRNHIRELALCADHELETMEQLALEANEVFRRFLADCGIDLIDWKLEFGRTSDGSIVIADEVSPDTCRFHDSATGAVLDKDVFRTGSGDLIPAYTIVHERIVNGVEVSCTPA